MSLGLQQWGAAMHLAEAVGDATKDPATGFRRVGTQGLYFIDSYWFERGWLAYSHSGEIAGGWRPCLSSWEAAQVDWEAVRLPAKLRRDIGKKYQDPLSARRGFDHARGLKARPAEGEPTDAEMGESGPSGRTPRREKN
jgi:hypothetical protein